MHYAYQSMRSTLVCTFTHTTHNHNQKSLCLPLEAVAKTPKQACGQVYPNSTTRVQGSIGSRNSAIHKGYHTSLRPSSLSKPRHPSLKVVITEAVADISKRNTQFYHIQQQDQRNTTPPQFAAREIPHKELVCPTQNFIISIQVMPYRCV